MNISVTPQQWAEQNIPRPLTIKPVAVNKPAVLVSAFILLAIGGLIVWGTVDMFFEQLRKDGTMNWAYLIVAVAITVGASWLFWLIQRRRKHGIIGIDKVGLTTVGGELFKWDDLQKIVFDKAYRKNAIPQEDRCTGIRFYFTKARLYTKYLAPDFQRILIIAHQVPVEKKNRFTGEYYH